VLRKIRRFLTLSSSERHQFLRAFVDLAYVDIGLRVLGFQALAERIPAVDEANERDVRPVDLVRATRYAYWLERASRHHAVPARCLHRSLALHQRLRREGLPSELRIGVRKRSDIFEAHAWVEMAGRIVNDAPMAVSSFAPLTTPNGEQPTWTSASDRVGFGQLARLGFGGVRWQ
jgi:hypothetical protein